MKKIIDIVSTTLMVSMVVSLGYMGLEPEIVTAASDTDEVVITLNVTAGISITHPNDTPMSTSLGVGTDKAIATTTWNVKTNNNTGYRLDIHASSLPAMKQSATIMVPDFQLTPATWSVTNQSAFGFSAYGTDVPTGTWGTVGATLCGATSTPNTALLYRGFNNTTDIAIATRNSTTTTAGVDSTVCYAVEQNNVYIASGAYTATVTATAVTI